MSCALLCFSAALRLNKNISAGKLFKYKSLRVCFRTAAASVPILSALSGWNAVTTHSLLVFLRESHSAFENSPFEHLTWTPLLTKMKMTVLILEKEHLLLCISYCQEWKETFLHTLNARALFLLWSMKSSLLLLCSEIIWREERRMAECDWKIWKMYA